MINFSDKVIKYLLGFVVVALLFLNIVMYITMRKADKMAVDLKQELLDSDSLRVSKEGNYQVLVKDVYTYKKLNKELKTKNKKLYESLKEAKKKPISITTIKAQPKPKINTIIISDTIRDGFLHSTFTDFYPEKDNYFVRYDATLMGDSIEGKWGFNEFDLDLVISEKQKGIFEIDVDTPDWLNITELEVKTLPLENIKPKHFGWIIGGNVGYDFKEEMPILGVEGGIKYKKNIITIQGSTNQEVLLGLKRVL